MGETIMFHIRHPQSSPVGSFLVELLGMALEEVSVTGWD